MNYLEQAVGNELDLQQKAKKKINMLNPNGIIKNESVMFYPVLNIFTTGSDQQIGKI